MGGLFKSLNLCCNCLKNMLTVICIKKKKKKKESETKLREAKCGYLLGGCVDGQTDLIAVQ